MPNSFRHLKINKEILKQVRMTRWWEVMTKSMRMISYETFICLQLQSPFEASCRRANGGSASQINDSESEFVKRMNGEGVLINL
jgi:hypothetical protein